MAHDLYKGFAVLLLLLTGCTQFTIGPEAFSQEQMAHSAGIGSMYLTSATYTGNHNCDTTPSGCCASGYHMCTATEAIQGGRRLEVTGTGRDTTISSTLGDVVIGQGGGSDCTGYSSTTATDNRSSCLFSESTGFWFCNVDTACSLSQGVWCCSD